MHRELVNERGRVLIHLEEPVTGLRANSRGDLVPESSIDLGRDF